MNTARILTACMVALLVAGGAAGEAGAADFSTAAGWRFAPADEFLPASRHNDLIGHEELPDFRREVRERLPLRAAVAQAPQLMSTGDTR